MQNFYRLPKETKARIFEQASARSNLPAFAIEKDYIKLSEIMIYGEKLAWHKLLSRITELKERINQLDFTVELNT